MGRFEWQRSKENLDANHSDQSRNEMLRLYLAEHYLERPLPL